MNNFYNPFIRYRYPSPQYVSPHNFTNYNNIDNSKIQNKTENTSKSNITSETDSTIQQNTRHNSNKPLIEFSGIKLYDDDLLILALIYFLYKENINDTLLFISLFALLLF